LSVGARCGMVEVTAMHQKRRDFGILL
jgi:hypothetical protein